MNIYYVPNGEIVGAVRDSGLLLYVPKVGTQILVVDETPANADVIKDVMKHVTHRLIDAEAFGKYHIDGDGDLAERDGWVEAPPEEF